MLTEKQFNDISAMTNIQIVKFVKAYDAACGKDIRLGQYDTDTAKSRKATLDALANEARKRNMNLSKMDLIIVKA